MRQEFRLLARPRAFMNQLQWSPNHWTILFTFAGLATIETFLGRSNAFYGTVLNYLQVQFSVGPQIALAALIGAKVLLMVVGAHLISMAVWMAGRALGRSSSHRVLSRRLAVVFAVLLTGFLCQGALSHYPHLFDLGYGFYMWGLILGYFSIREQFNLTRFESVIVGLFALFLVGVSWQTAGHIIETSLRSEIQNSTAKAHSVPQQHRRVR